MTDDFDDLRAATTTFDSALDDARQTYVVFRDAVNALVVADAKLTVARGESTTDDAVLTALANAMDLLKLIFDTNNADVASSR